jgi:hypothetical protein
MSAKFVDALRGYEYYLGERGAPSIEDVNHYLHVHGRKAIRDRTYGHYRKLLAHGFRSYIPINQFDVFQALGKLQMAADRRRYHRETASMLARLSRDRANWIEGSIVDRSLVGFGVRIAGRFAVSRGREVWVGLEDYRDIPTILVWKRYDKKADLTSVGLRAFEFVARYRESLETGDASRLKGWIRVSRESDGELNWASLFRVLDKTNELLESAAVLLGSVAESLGTEMQLARPVLAGIKFGSPGAFQIKVDLGVAEFLKVLLGKVQFWDRDKKHYDLAIANYGIEVARNALNLHREAVQDGISDDAIPAILPVLNSIYHVKELPKGLFKAGSLERGILTQSVIPAAAELVAGDDPEFEIETSISRKPRRSTARKHGRKSRRPRAGGRRA